MTVDKAISTFNQYGSKGIPFLFIINYSLTEFIIKPLSEIDPEKMLFSINGVYNLSKIEISEPPKHITFTKKPISMEKYASMFNLVMKNLKLGNSYLSNLTYKTPISTNLSLKNIFDHNKASYKLWYRDKWVVFSPETFVKIIDGKIYCNPMKGTIDANITNARQNILNNKKEAAEHATIVDLIRNDLSRIATAVKVDKYRYIDTLKTNQGDLLQVSSQISGCLASDYKQKLGEIMFSLLPAGSICGAPKKKTLEIIKEAENYNRGFYTGVMGIFDGKNLDSGVMIRFIEKNGRNLVFKSGGGITVNSKMEEEFSEMIRKVYLPF